MSATRVVAYSRTAPGGWWRWDDDGASVVWADGTTIVFRAELKAILELLAPAGLPPFPAIVIMLAALRGKAPGCAVPPTRVVLPVERGQFLQMLGQRHQTQVADGVRMLAGLAPQLGTRVSGKALLVEAILERADRLGAAESEIIAGAFDAPCFVAALNEAPGEAGVDNERALSLVLNGLRPFTADSLLLRVRTGVEAAPVARPEVELPREEQARRLFDALKGDDELAGVAQVARDLMAALRLPRLLVEPDELALGGAAGLTNRGPLDRLLVSELAHDDLTLAVRVALNEALYLRREPPAHRPERALAVLLDCGLRMWGVPRVLGAAAALALLGCRDGHGAARVWRASGRVVEPVELLSKHGLEAHLAAMTTELHPGLALPAWSEALEELGEVDAVLVTHRDALGDRAFQARLAAAELGRSFLLLVERDGTVELHALPWGSPRPLAQARIDVTKLFPRTPGRGVSLPLSEPDLSGLPAIFRERPFPLLLPVNAKVSRSHLYESGGLCVTEDGRLYHWDGPLRGARQLVSDLPKGRVSWLGADSAGRVIVVKGRSGDGCSSVTIAPINGGEVRVVRFTGPAVIPATLVQGEHLVVILNTRVVLVSLEAAEVLSETAFPPRMRWINQRYFGGPGGPCFLSCEGGVVKWEPLLTGRSLHESDVATILDHQGVGAWVLCRDGRLLGPTGSEVLKTGFQTHSSLVTNLPDGVLLQNHSSKQHFFLSLQPASIVPVTEVHAQVRKTSQNPRPPSRAILLKLDAATISSEHGLRLINRKGIRYEFSYSPAQGLRLIVSSTPKPAKPVPFVPISTPRKIGCSLRLAEWSSGSRAWLDSRGLLHLRSHDSSVPEVTLVLVVDAPLAGWCSDGVACGPAFFRSDSLKDEPGKVRDALKAFWNRAC